MRLLLGARAGTERADRAGFRPLDLALRNGHSNSEVVSLLTQKAQAHADRATVVSPRAALAAASITREERPSPPDESAPSVEQYRKVIKGKGGGLPPTKQEVAAATSVNAID